MIRTLLTMLAALAALCAQQASAQDVAMPTDAPMVEAAEWSAYAGTFLAPDGRIIDDANDGISHSEGQGYGLLLALLAQNRPDFERIWSFTRTRLMLRDDGLAVWKWDPAANPSIVDPNNASDGDILIAYALARAGEAWGDEGLVAEARRIASALARTSLFERDGQLLLRPGVDGFDQDDQPDGPIINLSYWVFEAFPALERLAPEADWARLAADGKALLARTLARHDDLVPDWMSVRDGLGAAEGFPAEFGYNALRIPLYLLRAGDDDEELLRSMRNAMTAGNGAIALVDLTTGETSAELTDPGYRAIPALVDCALDGTSLPEDIARFSPTLYYPSTLHLLALAHAREALPQCL